MISPTRANLMRLLILEKQAGWADTLLAAKNLAPKVWPALVKAPGQFGRAAKGTAAALAMPFVGEMTYRGLRSGGRDFEPEGTTQLYRKLFDTGFRASGLDSHLGNLANKFTEAFHGTEAADTFMGGVDNAVTKANNLVVSPEGQRAIHAAGQLGSGLKNIINPETRDAALAALRAGTREVASGASEGLAKGTARATFGDPTTAAAMLATTTVPLVLYDLYTRKQREEKARTDRLILRHLARREAAPVKTAGLLDTLVRLGRTPAPAWFQHTPKVPASEVAALLAKAKGDEVPVADVLKALHPHTGGWSLLNNPVTRNPVKTMVGAGGLAGVTKGMVNWWDAKGDTNPAQSTLDLLKETMLGLSMPVRKLDYALFQDRRDSVLSSLRQNPKLQQGRALVDKTWQAAQNVGASLKDNLNAPVAHVAPPPGWLERNREPLQWYGAGAAAIGLPLVVHKMINRGIDKKVLKDEAKGEAYRQDLFSPD